MLQPNLMTLGCYPLRTLPGTVREENLQAAGFPLDQLHFKTALCKEHRGDPLAGHGDHDQHVADQSLEWLRENGQSGPWVMHVGFLNPHWPIICPGKYKEMYDLAAIELPVDYRPDNPDLHPAIRHFQQAFGNAAEIRDEDHLRHILTTYYGMISCMDDHVGQLLDELDRQGIADDTYVIYTSDHGEACGEHGMFGKLTPYEASSGVPLVMRGPGVPAGKRVDDLVSLIDLYPTVLDALDLEMSEEERRTRPGASWLPLVKGESHERLDYVFSEYHGVFFPKSWYMIVKGDYKYVYHMNDRPQLFNLRQDPDELNGLAALGEHASRLSEFEALLRSVVDIDAVAMQVKRDFALITPDGRDLTLEEASPAGG